MDPHPCGRRSDITQMVAYNRPSGSLSCILILFSIGILLGLAASPPLAAKNGFEAFHYVKRQAVFERAGFAGDGGDLDDDAKTGATAVESMAFWWRLCQSRCCRSLVLILARCGALVFVGVCLDTAIRIS